MHYHFLLSVLSVLAVARPLSDRAQHLSPRWDDTRIKHAWDAVPVAWGSLGPPPAGFTIDLSIALKPHDENALIDALYEVSTPGHSKYGAYLTKEQVANLVTPRPDTLELVNSWLEYRGVPLSSVSMTHGGGWLTLTGVPVSTANDLLGASYQHFLHAETNETVLRTISYALPAVLHAHVQTVVPTTFFGSPQTPRQTPRVRRNGVETPQANYVTPSYLRWMYNTLAYVPSAADRNVFGTVGFKGRYASQDDLTIFMKKYRPDGSEHATFEVIQVDGGKFDSKNPRTEGNLNVQYAVAMTYNTPQIYYSTSATVDPIVAWFAYMLGVKDPDVPQTISTTYGVAEQLVPEDYAIGVCLLYAHLGARGASVLYASGNWGVGKGSCKVKDRSGNVQAEFRPTFPASCPYVTAVGGTTGDDPEKAADLSGGGFSKHFSRPPYQKNVVPAYIQSIGDQYQNRYNAKGRGLPDIAAQALGYVTISNGEIVYRQGTSCSTPTVAGIISLLNDYQLSHGKYPLGFLNPWLYGNALTGKGFNDITSGSNPGCDTDGFSATAGWDPVTGLGTPNFQKLVGTLPDTWVGGPY
ncbi:subtilisin-like protein [Lactarius indigo]|nr:subtilisin-like protein [Lactarius indigo]